MSFDWYLKNIYPDLHVPEDRQDWHGAVSVRLLVSTVWLQVSGVLISAARPAGAELRVSRRVSGLQRPRPEPHRGPPLAVRLPRPGGQPGGWTVSHTFSPEARLEVTFWGWGLRGHGVAPVTFHRLKRSQEQTESGQMGSHL